MNESWRQVVVRFPGLWESCRSKLFQMFNDFKSSAGVLQQSFQQGVTYCLADCLMVGRRWLTGAARNTRSSFTPSVQSGVGADS